MDTMINVRPPFFFFWIFGFVDWWWLSWVGVGGLGGRAVRREGNFWGKKRLTCKIRHLGGQNGKTPHGPKVTFSSTRSFWRAPRAPQRPGRCPQAPRVPKTDFWAYMAAY